MMSGEDGSEDAPVTLRLETFQYILENESLHDLVKDPEKHCATDVFLIQHTKKPIVAVFLGKLKEDATADEINNILQKVAPHNPKCIKLVSESKVQHSILQTVVRQLICVIGVENLELNNVLLESLPEEVYQLSELSINLSDHFKDRHSNLTSIEGMVTRLLKIGRKLPDLICENIFKLSVFYFLLVDVQSILSNVWNVSMPVLLKCLHDEILNAMDQYNSSHEPGQSKSDNVSLRHTSYRTGVNRMYDDDIYSHLRRNVELPDVILSDYVQQILQMLSSSTGNGKHNLERYLDFSSNFRELVCVRKELLKRKSIFYLPGTAMTNVSNIYFNHNGLNHFPCNICRCRTLKVVCLNHNRIITLPDNIGYLVSMRQLSLSHNHLKILPQSIGDCLGLTTLQMDNNKLERIPDSIGNLRHLEKFDVSSNKLKVLPLAICRCTELTYINVANNEIQFLPQNIGDLVKVEYLDFQGNRVSCLPLTFDRIRTLTKQASKLLLKGNPLIHPPVEVCLQGIYGIHTYLKELRRSDAHKMNYQRLDLVGETMSGKTSLAHTLMTNSSQLTRDEQRTVVLEQHAWPAEGGLDIQINDFGGHEMYHLTSPCFFTPDAVHLLVFDINKYTPQDHHKHIGSWLDIVRMKVPRATIRMVGTHQDECSPEELSEKLQYIADRVAKDEEKWKADITSQLDMLKHDSNECLGEIYVGRQKRQECLQIQLKSLPNLYEPGSPIEIRTVSSSDFNGIDNLSSYIRELCKQVGLKKQDTIPKLWFDLYEMLQSEEYDSQHFVHWDSLQTQFKISDEQTDEISDEQTDDMMAYLTFDSDDEISDEGTDNADDIDKEKMALSLDLTESVNAKSCEVPSCLDTNTSGTSVPSKVEVKSDGQIAKPVSVDTVNTNDNTNDTSDRMLAALQYLKAVGLITWYPDDEKLKHIIFHRPAKLVDIFKAIVNHNIKNQLDFKDLVFSTVGQFSKQSFAMAVLEFESTANLSVAIVRCLWHKLGFSKEDTESLIKLMVKFDICYEVLDSEVAPGLHPSHRLHIPWYLSADPLEELSKMWPQPPPDDYQQLTMQYHFPTFWPRGLHERASVRLHRHIAQRVNWKNGVWAVVDSRQVLLTRSMTEDGSGREEVFTLSVRAPVTEQQPGHTNDVTLLWTTFLSIHRDMQSLIQEWPGLRCNTFLQCAHCVKMGKDPPNLFPGEVLEQQCRKDVRTIPCPQYPMTVPVQQVRAELVYPPNSCLKEQNVACPEGLASETIGALNLVSEMDRLHLGIDTLQLQQATALVQKKYPGISFIPSRDATDEAQRTQRVREFHDQLSRRVQHFSSVIDYSIDYEDFPTITERMKSVCLLQCPNGAATGFLVGPRHVMTNHHFLQLYVEPALRTNTEPNRYVATFHFSSMQNFCTRFNPTNYLSWDAELDYVILELEHAPLDVEPLGKFVSELFHQDGIVIVVGHPGGQRKRVDFCPIAVVDNNFEIHVRNARGIPDIPQDFPQQVAGRANYHTSRMFHGSSGSPGFDKSGNLVVMHTRGFFPYVNSPSIVEQGVLMASIREHVRTTHGNDTWFSDIFPPQMMDIE